MRSQATVWLTGLPGAGKSTLASALQVELIERGQCAAIVDGDTLREGLSDDLGLSRADRAEQARRAAHIAALISRSGVVAIVALVSPHAGDRRRARVIHAERGLPFYEVWIDTPRSVCHARDPKGLYARARAGEITGLTGFDAPYDEPELADIRIGGFGEEPAETARRLADLLPYPAPVGAL
jgi:bifunctional enzyme CysN/CysC